MTDPVVLSYDPLPTSVPVRGLPSFARVMGFGLVSTLAAFVIAEMIRGTTHIDPMSYFLFKFVPISAIIAGVVAGLGFNFGAKRVGIRGAWPLVLAVFLTECAAYLLYFYTRFRLLGPLFDASGLRVDFWTYFNAYCQSISWKGEGHALGDDGVVIQILTITGFSLASAITSALIADTYCKHCKLYHRQLDLLFMNAAQPFNFTVSTSLVSPVSDPKSGTISSLESAILSGDALTLRQVIQPLASKSKEAMSMPRRYRLRITNCPRCHEGRVTFSMVEGFKKDCLTSRVFYHDLDGPHLLALEFAINESRAQA